MGRGREPPGPEARRYPGAPSGGGRGGGAAGEKPGQPQRHRKRSSPDAHQRSAGRPARASGRSPPKSPGGRAHKRRPHGPPGPPGLEPAGPEARRDAPGGTRRGHAKRKGKAERSQGDQSSAAGARSEARPRPKRSGASESPRSRKPRRSGAHGPSGRAGGGRRGARARQAKRGREVRKKPRGAPPQRRSEERRGPGAGGQIHQRVWERLLCRRRPAGPGPRPGPLPHLDLLGLKCRSCCIFRLRTPPCRVCDAPCVQGPSWPGRMGRSAAHHAAARRRIRAQPYT